MTDKENISFIKLCAIKDIGAITAMRLLKHFSSPQAIFSATKTQLMQVEKIGEKTAENIIKERELIDVSKIIDAMNRIGARYINFQSPVYPKLLNTLPDKPIGLYCVGECDFTAPCIAIVGSRNCSVYGQITARRFAGAFARAGYTVVSGMARGIDAMAHLGAIENSGKTIAVLGSGVDVVYPPENLELYKKIIDNGSVISEFPVGARADRQNFPIRNRLVAGMSLATLVIESDIKGGSMITARIAGEYGRDVFAIPGRIDSTMSRGCNALIRDGAILASSPEDIIDALNFARPVQMTLLADEQKPAPQPAPKEDYINIAPNTPSKPKLQNLSDDEEKIFTIIKHENQIGVDKISELSQMNIKNCLPVLLMLEIKRLITKDAGGNYSVRQ